MLGCRLAPAAPITGADTVGGQTLWEMHELRSRSTGASAVDTEYGGRPHGRPMGDACAGVLLCWCCCARPEASGAHDDEKSSSPHKWY